MENLKKTPAAMNGRGVEKLTGNFRALITLNLIGAQCLRARGNIMSKRKTGKRDTNGRLVKSARDVTPLDRGSDWVRDRQAKFGQHYSSALGRAFASGLLNDPANDARAAERLQNAQRFASLHRRVYGGEFYGKNPLDRSPGGQDMVADITDADRSNREWLRVNEKRIEYTAGRSFMDQLLWAKHTDNGPYWLDNLLAAKPGERDAGDAMILELALKAIDAIGAVSVVRVERVGLAA